MNNPPETPCTHGVEFDLVGARLIERNVTVPKTDNPDYDAALRNATVAQLIREKWPRGYFTGEKPCPKCGYARIYYASTAHYIYGDW